MYIDFKITTWERIEIPEEHKEKVLKAIKNKEITSTNDMFDKFSNDFQISLEDLSEVDEQMTPEENNGCSTIEVYGEKTDIKTIWDNSIDCS